MPFDSRAQERFLFATNPKVAHKMARDAGMDHRHKTKKSKQALKKFRALPYHSQTKSAVAARKKAHRPKRRR